MVQAIDGCCMQIAAERLQRDPIGGLAWRDYRVIREVLPTLSDIHKLLASKFSPHKDRRIDHDRVKLSHYCG